MSHKKEHKTLLLTVLISAAALAYAFLVFVPIQKSIAGLRGQLREQRAFVAASVANEAERAKLEVELAAAREVSGRWEARAPDAERIATLIGSISELARDAGNTVRRIEPRPPVSLRMLRQHPAEMALAGSFHEVCAFLRELEQRPETIWVDRVGIQPSENGELVQCEINFTVFADNSENSG